MQSFGAPRSTTNPYLQMLDTALTATPGLDHLRFDRKRALLGRYDALHLHWPETLLGDGGRLKRAIRLTFAQLLLARLRLTRTAIVRTTHNLDLPTGVSGAELRFLKAVERHADLRIILNRHTHVSGRTALIPHGHYRDWFAAVDVPDAVPDTLAFVGLVRRYKGVEHLLKVFADTAARAPELRLRVSGSPSLGLADEIGRLAANDPRVLLDLRFLPEPDFARAVSAASGVVLPYPLMHNSGTALAALSLNRPVLVPNNAVNADLASEVGPSWVHMYDGKLSAEDLLAFSRAVRTRPAQEPRLDARNWSRAGTDHLLAYRRAVVGRRMEVS